MSVGEDNRKLDLVWILPEFVGELFLTVYIPIRLLTEAGSIGILSVTGMLYLAVIYLLLTQLKLNSLREFGKIKWKDDVQKV